VGPWTSGGLAGPLNRRFWMWVLVVPAVVLGAAAAVIGTFAAVGRFWYMSAPLLLVWAVMIWRGLAPAASAEAPEEAAPRPGKLDVADMAARLVATLLLLALSLVALGLVFALVSAAQAYWYASAPLAIGLVVLLILAYWPDRKPKEPPIR
jgi:hypothetical protein